MVDDSVYMLLDPGGHAPLALLLVHDEARHRGVHLDERRQGMREYAIHGCVWVRCVGEENELLRGRLAETRDWGR